MMVYNSQFGASCHTVHYPSLSLDIISMGYIKKWKSTQYYFRFLRYPTCLYLTDLVVQVDMLVS